MSCPLCGTVDPLAADEVMGRHRACDRCGLVTSGTLFQDAGPSGVSDGWQARAANLGTVIPKQAIDPGRVSVDTLAGLLARGPLYLETPNAREPAVSLSHFFRNRSPVYYEPATLAVALAMAGADDLALDEVAGMITCVASGTGPRLTYAEAVAQTGIEVPQNVTARMRAHFDPKPPEALGDVVPGACFLCGGERRAWRVATICSTCSALTLPTHGALLDDLATQLSTAPHGAPVSFFAPDMRTTSAADCEKVVMQNSVMLDESTWCAAMLMAGADGARAQKHQGALELQARAFGVPRRKTLAEARETMQRGVFREARHTVAIWNEPVPQASRYELWVAGEDCDDQEYLRAEAKRDRLIASAAEDALRVTMNAMEAKQDDPDDWHRDPYMNGFRMGAAAAWQRAQVAIATAWMTVVHLTVRDE